MQARKTIAILFCDGVDSTPLGEQLDDALRAVRSVSAMRERLVSLNDELEEA